MTLTAETAMFGHADEETAHLVDDYPYGFRLRCQIRYWIETTKHGDRMCSQTLNPKNDRWNKPKKGTYSPVAVMYINDEGHVTHASVSPNSSDEWIVTFRAVTDGHLSDEQKASLARVIATKKVFANVRFEMVEGPVAAERQAEQAANDRRIAHAVAAETAVAREELG